MRTPGLFAIVIAISLFHACIALAFETDQYNLPPEPLADIGEEVREYTVENILTAVAKVNAEIAKCLSGKCDSDTKRLAYLRSEEAIARAVFRELGSGIVPFTNPEVGEFARVPIQPGRTRPAMQVDLCILPTVLFTILPTVNSMAHSLGPTRSLIFFSRAIRITVSPNVRLQRVPTVMKPKTKLLIGGK